MDNTLQVKSAGDFNVKACELIVYLLNNSAKINWSIRAGKSKGEKKKAKYSTKVAGVF